MKKLTAAFGLAFVLAACSSAPPPPPVVAERVLSPKIVMDVKIINLTDRSGMQPSSSLYNNNNFSPTITDAIKQWAVDRLQANGQTGQAIIVIKKASLTAQPLPVKTGIDGWFTRQQSTKYVGNAEVSIEASGKGGYAVTDASATRAVSLPENPTEFEKQNAYATVLSGLMKDLGENLESGIHVHMSNFVTTAPIYGVTAVPTKMPAVQSTTDQDATAATSMAEPVSSGRASDAK